MDNNENSALSFNEALANLERVYNEVMADNQRRINKISEGYNKLSEEISDLRKSQEQMHENNIRLNQMLDEHERVCEEVHTCHSFIQKLQDKNYGPRLSAETTKSCWAMAKYFSNEANKYLENAANATEINEIEEYAAKADKYAKKAAEYADDAVNCAKRAKERADELNTEEGAKHAYIASTYIKPAAEFAAAAAKAAEEVARIVQVAKEAAYANETSE